LTRKLFGKRKRTEDNKRWILIKQVFRTEGWWKWLRIVSNGSFCMGGIEPSGSTTNKNLSPVKGV
jgi:hypothetical protein